MEGLPSSPSRNGGNKVGNGTADDKQHPPMQSAVMFEEKPFHKGYNVSEVLRSGRWLRPGDFIRCETTGIVVEFRRVGLATCFLHGLSLLLWFQDLILIEHVLNCRDKVQSRGVLLLGLSIAVIFVALLTISDSSFLFPRSFAKYGVCLINNIL